MKKQYRIYGQDAEGNCGYFTVTCARKTALGGKYKTDGGETVIRKKAPGGGRIAKPNRRHNLAIRADLSERLVNAAERDGVTVTAVVEGLIEKYL